MISKHGSPAAALYDLSHAESGTYPGLIKPEISGRSGHDATTQSGPRSLVINRAIINRRNVVGINGFPDNEMTPSRTPGPAVAPRTRARARALHDFCAEVFRT